MEIACPCLRGWTAPNYLFASASVLFEPKPSALKGVNLHPLNQGAWVVSEVGGEQFFPDKEWLRANSPCLKCEMQDMAINAVMLVSMVAQSSYKLA